LYNCLLSGYVANEEINHDSHNFTHGSPHGYSESLINEIDSNFGIRFTHNFSVQARLRLGMMANNSALRLKVKSQKSEKP
jgi:hypothetical protein